MDNPERLTSSNVILTNAPPHQNDKLSWLHKSDYSIGVGLQNVPKAK